jgi:hypothetical protein
LSLLLPALPALAWGPIGHRAVGRVAERHLSRQAAKELAAILGAERLAYIATWSDEIRSDPTWKRADDWHWVTIPMDRTYADSDKNQNGDVIGAIACFERVLADRTLPLPERRQAVKWLVHLVGDVHQPMHVGARNDQGGNKVEVFWFGAPSNLHSVWDGALIKNAELSFSELAEAVDSATADEVKAWQGTTPLEWADESREMGQHAYPTGDVHLSYPYVFQHWPEVEQRIQRAGVRLAGLINRVLGPGRSAAGSWLPSPAASAPYSPHCAAQ